MYTHIHRTCIIVKNWKPAEYQLTAGLINTFQYIYTMSYHMKQANKKKLENKPTHLRYKVNLKYPAFILIYSIVIG